MSVVYNRSKVVSLYLCVSNRGAQIITALHAKFTNALLMSGFYVLNVYIRIWTFSHGW